MKKFENMWIILLMSLFLFGCGSSSILDLPNAQPKGDVLSGPLKVRGVIVSYSDVQNAYSNRDVNILFSMLNEFIIRNSSGNAWLTWDVVQAALANNQAYYDDFDYTDPKSFTLKCNDPKVMNNTDPEKFVELQKDTLLLVPREEYTIYFTPYTPLIYIGIGDVKKRNGVSWLSVTSDLDRMPLPHEFGHMLGLKHQNTGTMIPFGPEVTNYNGWYDNNSLFILGWPLHF